MKLKHYDVRYINRLGWGAARSWATMMDEIAEIGLDDVGCDIATWAEVEAYQLRLFVAAHSDITRQEIRGAWDAGFYEGWMGEETASRASKRVWTLLMAAPFNLKETA